VPREYKMIRLDPEVYYVLDQFRHDKEKYSDAVCRLLCMHYQMRNMLKALAGQKEEGASED